jgi:hypothetical protein
MRMRTSTQSFRTTLWSAHSKEKIKGPGRTRWFCLCDCGNTTTVEGKKLVNGNTKSCGCLKLEPQHNITHHHTRGGKHSPEYSTWANMLKRCRPGYKNHGDRGIAVCDRWRFGEGGKSGFECFLSDMSQKPSPKHEIDRWPDNDGNYEPDNCRWATRSEQQNNKRTNVFIEVDGRAQTKAQWEREFEWAEGKFYRRIRSIKRVLDRTILPPIIDDDRDPQELTEASLRKAGFVRSTVSGEWIRRDVRRAYFKAMWDAMDGLLLRRSGMTAATLDVIRRDLEVAQ